MFKSQIIDISTETVSDKYMNINDVEEFLTDKNTIINAALIKKDRDVDDITNVEYIFERLTEDNITELEQEYKIIGYIIIRKITKEQIESNELTYSDSIKQLPINSYPITLWKCTLIRPEFQNKGIGTDMVINTAQYVSDLPVITFTWNCSNSGEKITEKFGGESINSISFNLGIECTICGQCGVTCTPNMWGHTFRTKMELKAIQLLGEKAKIFF